MQSTPSGGKARDVRAGNAIAYNPHCKQNAHALQKRARRKDLCGGRSFFLQV
jgi:hypothetical protein